MRILHKIFAVCLFFLLHVAVSGQDIITTVKGTAIQATVVDAKGSAVSYRHPGSHKVYKKSKKEVVQIQYANGRIEHYAGTAPASNVEASRSGSTSETPRFLFGLSAGLNLATGRYDYKTSVAPPDLSFRLAPAAGINLDWRVFRHFALQMNFLYKGKGDRISIDRWAKDLYNNTPVDYTEPVVTVRGQGYRTTKISYAEGSFLPVFVIGKNLEIGLGGYLGYGLNGNQKDDYTLQYDFPDFPIGDETYQAERPVVFVTLAPESVEAGKLYLNRFDYGVLAHLGYRLNPVKISFDVSHGLKQWEPDSKLAALFFNDIDHTYNLSGALTVGWFFGAR